jgi:hypothetical protein
LPVEWIIRKIKIIVRFKEIMKKKQRINNERIATSKVPAKKGRKKAISQH